MALVVISSPEKDKTQMYHLVSRNSPVKILTTVKKIQNQNQVFSGQDQLVSEKDFCHWVASCSFFEKK